MSQITNVIVACLLVLAIPFGGVWFPGAAILPWLWLTWCVSRRGELNYTWIILFLAVELVSPYGLGVASLFWFGLGVGLKLWLHFFPTANHVVSRVVLGLVSALIWVLVAALHGWLFKGLGLWSEIIWQQFLLQILAWLVVLCLERGYGYVFR